MDSPVRKALKRNDYLRHKLFRKIKRRQRNKIQLDLKIAEKELKRRLRRPKFDGGTDDNKVKVTERTYPDGTVVYFADDGKTLTPINTMDSGDMSNWTWLDADNPRITYTGIGNTKDPGEIKQSEGPKSGLGKLHKKLYQVSNRHLQDPIFGAYARFADSWDNDTNPLKAIWELPATKAAVMELAWAKGLQAANRFKNAAVNYERLGKMAPKELEEFFMSRPDLVRESNRAKLFGAAYNKFADDVVKPKYVSAIAATGREYTPEMDAAISNTPKVYEADFGPYSKWGGYYSTGGGRIMMNSRAAGTDSQLFGRHAHEVHHGYRDLLGLLLKFHPNLDIQTNGESIAQIARSGYTPGEMNALEAYQFTPLKLKLSPDLKPLWEKGATNAEIVSRIYYDTGLTGKELNDAIMKMPKSKLIEYLKTNAYGQSFLKSPWTKDKEKAIREALTTVASVMPFGVAYNLKYDGGKKAGIDVTYRDAADAYDYLNAHPDASVVLDEQSVVGHAPNASQRLAKYIQESAARDIDKVMLGYLATGIAPVAMQAAAPGVIAASDAIGSSAAGQVATKALTSPIGKSMIYGTAGATGADIAAKAATGKTFEEWGEQDLGLPWYLSGFVNPGGYLMPVQGVSSRYLNNLGRSTRNALNLPLNGFKFELPNQYAGLVDFGQDSNEINLLSSIAKNTANYPGYLIKMLMAGNPLEKQLSKTGTISINSIKALSNKASNVEKSIVEKILNSDKFSGKKNIHYNTFKKAVLEELIGSYNRVPKERYEDYGIERLGYQPIKLERYSEEFKRHAENRADKLMQYATKHYLETDPVKYTRLANIAQKYRNMAHAIRYLRTKDGKLDYGVNLNTFTFESPHIPYGNTKHYEGNPIGHSRTYTTADEPEVLYVMESLSDWAQSKASKISDHPLDVEDIDWNYNYEHEPDIVLTEKGKEHLKSFHPHPEQELHLRNNYLQRQLQENLRYAAENGQTKMRYPTPETAAKIEGYLKGFVRTEDLDAIVDLINKLERELELSLDVAHNEQLVLRIDALRERFNRTLDESNLDYSPEHKTILKKYSDFQKHFKKLYKDAEVREITDNKGNTWYEVDVPKNYLNREWQYGSGKDVRIKLPKRRGNQFEGGKDESLKYVANVSDLDVRWNPETGYMEYNGKEYPVGMDEVVVTAPRRKFSWLDYYQPIWDNQNAKNSGFDAASTESLIKLLDPSGISNWKDVGNAFSDFVNDPDFTTGTNLAFSALGAIPYVGKYGKVLLGANKVLRIPRGLYKTLFKTPKLKLDKSLSNLHQIFPVGIPKSSDISNYIASFGRLYNTDIPVYTELRYSAGSPNNNIYGFINPIDNKYTGSYKYYDDPKQENKRSNTYSGKNSGDIDILRQYLYGDVMRLSKNKRHIKIGDYEFPDNQYDVKFLPVDTLKLGNKSKAEIENAILNNKVIPISTDELEKGLPFATNHTLVDGGRMSLKPYKNGNRYYADIIDEWGLTGNGGILGIDFGKLSDIKAKRFGGGPMTLKQDSIPILFNDELLDDPRDEDWFLHLIKEKGGGYQNEGYNSGKDIHIKPSKRGTFTAAAKKHGMSVQAYARKVLKAPKGKYSSAMRKKANFARNASRWNK